MATSESAAARAVAVHAPAEDPASGLFPEKKPPATAKPENAVTPQPAPAHAPETESGAEGEPEPGQQAKTEREAEPGQQAEAEREPEPGQPQPAPEAAPETPQARAEPEAARRTAPEARTETEEETAPARPAATAPGRPGKPLVAAAVAGGVILIGATLLISGLSGSDDDPAPASAAAPAGSRMGPDAAGPGFVPGRQNAPDDDTGQTPRTGRAAGSKPDARNGGTAKSGGVHEAGAPDEKTVGHRAGEPDAKAQGTPEKTREPSKSEAVDGQESTGKQPAGAPAKDSARVAPVTYSHFIGPGCDTPGFATSDRWRDSNEGWRGSGGSQTSYGCSGFYYSLPMSGSSTKTTDWAQWKFPTGGVTKGSCQVSVFIPNVRDVSYVGGSPAHYTVHRYFEAKSSTVIDTFEINQTSHLGQWVNAGTFPVSTGKISIVLDNRGSGANNRHAAAAPIKVNCTAS
ncbi:hypothetical protein [Streptomyces sp. NPDC019224]|uniref:hypothetical protein n=1 Tax=Streptomyces sp. NPDC019224 TaxID=3154484 RepID=UPI0034028AF1